MPNSYRLTYDGTGAQTIFTAPAVDPNVSTLNVFVSNVPQVEDVGAGGDYTWDNLLQQITFAVAPPTGTGNVDIFRFTSTEDAKVVYQKDGTLTETDVNISLDQLRNRINELTEFTHITVLDGKWDVQSTIITNLLFPVDANDAAPKGYVDQEITTLSNAVNAALALIVDVNVSATNGSVAGKLDEVLVPATNEPFSLAVNVDDLELSLSPQGVIGVTDVNDLFFVSDDSDASKWKTLSLSTLLAGIVDNTTTEIIGNEIVTKGFTGTTTREINNTYDEVSHNYTVDVWTDTWTKGVLTSTALTTVGQIVYTAVPET